MWTGNIVLVRTIVILNAIVPEVAVENDGGIIITIIQETEVVVRDVAIESRDDRSIAMILLLLFLR